MYFSVVEWSENETHASEIHEYLLTLQTKSLEILNLSYSCFSPPTSAMGSQSAMSIWRYLKKNSFCSFLNILSVWCCNFFQETNHIIRKWCSFGWTLPKPFLSGHSREKSQITHLNCVTKSTNIIRLCEQIVEKHN